MLKRMGFGMKEVLDRNVGRMVDFVRWVTDTP